MPNATAEKTKATGKPDILASMNKETAMPVPTRGRGLAPETIAVRDELLECMEKGEIRSFSNVTVENKEEFSRIVRNAGSHVDFEIATRHDKAASKLYWGPKSVMDDLASKKGK